MRLRRAQGSGRPRGCSRPRRDRQDPGVRASHTPAPLQSRRDAPKRTELSRRAGRDPRTPAPGSPPRAPARGAPAPAPGSPPRPSHLPPAPGSPTPAHPPAFLGEGGLREPLRVGPAPPGLPSDRPRPQATAGRRDERRGPLVPTRAPVGAAGPLPPGPLTCAAAGRSAHAARRTETGLRSRGGAEARAPRPALSAGLPLARGPEGRARPAPRCGGAGPSSARRGAAHAPRKGPDRWA